MNFWSAFERSLILQGTLTVGLAGAVIYLTVTGQEVPDVLSVSFGTVIGYFFANKSDTLSKKHVETIEQIHKAQGD